MREYLMCVVGGTLVVGAVLALVPERQGDRTKKYVTLVGSLCVLCLLISPLRAVGDLLDSFSEKGIDDLLEGIGEQEKYDEIYRENLLALGRDAVSTEIIRLLGEKFGIPPDECHVNIRSDNDGEQMNITRVTVILSGKSLFRDPYEIEGYISEILGCECVVAG